MADDTNPYLSSLLGIANAFATPLAKKLVGDKTPSQPATQVANSTLNESIQNSRLNGSGPADPAMAAQAAPTTLHGFINGTGSTEQAGSIEKKNTLWIVLAALGGLLLIVIVLKMK